MLRRTNDDNDKRVVLIVEVDVSSYPNIDCCFPVIKWNYLFVVCCCFFFLAIRRCSGGISKKNLGYFQKKNSYIK